MFRFVIGDDLELRLFEDRHAQELFALTDENRGQLRPWLPWIDRTQSPADSLNMIKGGMQQFADNSGFQAGIWFRGDLSGVIGFHYISWVNRKTEIGYWLGASFQGQGLMTRACRAMVTYAFDEFELNRVEIRCATDNIRSRAVPERLGFKEEGVLRQVEWRNDHFGDLVVYGMLASEWKRKAGRPTQSTP